MSETSRSGTGTATGGGNWRELANCRGVNPELFFPERGTSTDPPKAICHTCSVIPECLEAGMAEKFGIWGETTERQRRQIRTAKRAAAS